MSNNERPLRPGDVVEVRSAAEILATLDGNASLEAMPFMPEMIRYAGRRFTVSRRVDKICDTVSCSQNWSRRMLNTVYLEDLRCDGAGHDGCQAGCKIYWKEAWLRRVDNRSSANSDGNDKTAELERITRAATRTERVREGQRNEVWRCQATEAVNASTRMRTSHLAQYWRELTNGNFSFPRFIFLLVRGFFMEIASRIGLLKPLPLHGSGSKSTQPPLNLGAGDLVRVRSPAEIVETLDQAGLDRGLSFDREMLPYCGRTFRIKQKVQRIIDDKTGRMLKIPKDCLILEGVVCSGERTPGNWFCPRQIYPFWRESWLERAEESGRDDTSGHAR